MKFCNGSLVQLKVISLDGCLSRSQSGAFRFGFVINEAIGRLGEAGRWVAIIWVM